jgi:hypothetical protein
MTIGRVISFYPHVVGRPDSVGPDSGGSREPISPFVHLMERRTLTPRQLRHRQRMLVYLRKHEAQRADHQS